jgi:hypothetical protein
MMREMLVLGSALSTVHAASAYRGVSDTFSTNWHEVTTPVALNIQPAVLMLISSFNS